MFTSVSPDAVLNISWIFSVTKCDYLYLVRDIIDVWQMKKQLHWNELKESLKCVDLAAA